MDLTKEQSLNNLYAASRMAKLSADEHDLMRKCYEQIAAALAASDKKPEPAQAPTV